MKQITLGVKLNETEATVFQHWAKLNGLTTSQALSLFVECVLKMQHGDAIRNEKLATIMQQWDCFRDIEHVGNVIAPGAKVDVVETIYLIQEEGKRGTMPVLVEPTFFGDPKYSTNLDEILDEVMHSCCRGLNSRLTRLAKRLDTNGITDTITALCDYFERNEDEVHNDIMEMFKDSNRHEYGRDTDLIKYIRHNRRTIEEPTQLTLFNDEQRQELPQDNRERTMAEPEQADEADE